MTALAVFTKKWQKLLKTAKMLQFDQNA